MRDVGQINQWIKHGNFQKAARALEKIHQCEVNANAKFGWSTSQWCDNLLLCIANSPRLENADSKQRSAAAACLASLLSVWLREQPPATTPADLTWLVRHAASTNSIGAVRVLVGQAKEHCSPGVLSEVRAAALLAAAHNGYADMVQYLVDQEGTDVMATNDDGETALDLAVSHNRHEVIRYLLPRFIDRQLLQSAPDVRLRRPRSSSLAEIRLQPASSCLPSPFQLRKSRPPHLDPTRRISIHLDTLPAYDHHHQPLYAEVCLLAGDRPPIPSEPQAAAPFNETVTMRQKTASRVSDRNSLPPIFPARRTASTRLGSSAMTFQPYSPFPLTRRPTGLAVDSLTSSQQQTMFNCLGKGSVQSSPCVENATSAGRRHTLGGSTIDPPPAAMRHVNPPHPHNFAQSSASRPVQKVSCSMWNSQTGPSSPTTSSQGTHPEILRARAVTPFRDVTYGVQTLCFNEGDIIGVFTDSMTSSDGGIGAPVWWRGFRLANGPNGGIGVFPSSHVTLLQSPTCTRPFLPHSAQPAKKSDLSVQTDTNSSCSSTDDEVDEARDETDGDGASPSVVSSGNGEALHDTEARVLREIEALASTALQLPGGLTSTDKQPTLPPPLVGHANPIASSNRNSAASLDSGRGSAYATSSDGTKTVSTGVSATFPQPYHHVSTSVDYGQAKCPHLASGATPPYYMSPPASLCSPSRRTPQGYHRTPSAHPSASTCSSASSASSGASSGGSSCSSCSGASGNVSSDRTPVELLVNWLSSAGFSDYTTCLVSAGYDLSTLRRATPEDLNACGVTNPRHRQQLRARLSRLQLPENLPDHIPVSVFEWLSILNLTNYWPAFQSQGLLTFEKISVLTWEDLEEIGITKLGHQKKLILAVERLRRALAKRDEDQAGGGDSLTRHCRAQKHQVLSSPSHSATAAVPVVEEAEGGDGGLPDPTPPPPPAFQDPPLPGRKTSVDFSAAYGSSGSSHHRHHFSTSYLTDVERVPAGDGVGGEGSTKSDPLPRSAREGGSEEQSEGTHKSLQHPPQPPFSDVFLPTRQRHRAATAAATSATLAIPVSVANQMIPPLASGTAMDKDLQDMQDIRSMLDKLSEHLVPRGSP